MKHARDDYNRIQDPANKIPVDEPVFLVRGQDISAPPTVRFWADQNDANGGDPNLSRRAREWADLMERWPVKKAADGLPQEHQQHQTEGGEKV